MYLHVNFECSLESFFYFPNLRLFYYQEGGWIFCTIRSCLLGFFLCCAFFFAFFSPTLLSFSNLVCQIPVCVKGEGVLEKTMKCSAYAGNSGKSSGLCSSHPTPPLPLPKSNTTQMGEIIAPRG